MKYNAVEVTLFGFGIGGLMVAAAALVFSLFVNTKAYDLAVIYAAVGVVSWVILGVIRTAQEAYDHRYRRASW